jgi:hypothetical protein
MTELAILLLAIAAFWAFADWRFGLPLCVGTAILQDPIRKLVADQPVIFVIFVGIVFAAACLGATVCGVSLTPNQIFGRFRRIITPIQILLLLIVLEAFNSLYHFDNPMLTTIGLLNYLLPLPAIVFAYQLVHRGGEAPIYQFVKVYLIFAIVALTTVYLEYAGYDWSVFGQVGAGLRIYDKYLGAELVPHSGIFRAAEIAAWHSMACACFVIMLLTSGKPNIRNVLAAIAVVAILLAISVLTGRRKSIMGVAVFASTYLVLWFIFRRGVVKLGLGLAVAGVIAFNLLMPQLEDDSSHTAAASSAYSLYVARSKSVFEDAPARFSALGIESISWAYNWFGVFGAGLGAGAQGAQYFGRNAVIAGAAEGGLGKITLELGLPGLFVMGWLALVVLNHLWRIMRAATKLSPRVAGLSYGLFSFLVANAAEFSVATQAYGDLFILLILGWTLGFLLAVPLLLERELKLGPAVSRRIRTQVRGRAEADVSAYHVIPRCRLPQ